MTARRVALIGAIVGVAGISTAAYVIRPAGGLGLSADAAIAEYRRAAARLELGPGHRWPATLPFFRPTGPDGTAVSYGAGSGTIRAVRHWFCSWLPEALDAPTAARRRRARRQLARVGAIDGAPPRDLHRFTTMLDAMSGGDASELREFATTCPAPG